MTARSKRARARRWCAHLAGGLTLGNAATACTGVLGDFTLGDTGAASTFPEASVRTDSSAPQAGPASVDASRAFTDDAGLDASEAESSDAEDSDATLSVDAAAAGEGGGAHPIRPADAADEGDSRDALDAATAGGDAGAACTDTAGCGPGQICGFPTTPACSAKGQCFTPPKINCNAISLGCACDGSEVNIACNGLPGGYAPKPLLQPGPCTQ